MGKNKHILVFSRMATILTSLTSAFGSSDSFCGHFTEPVIYILECKTPKNKNMRTFLAEDYSPTKLSKINHFSNKKDKNLHVQKKPPSNFLTETPSNLEFQNFLLTKKRSYFHTNW